VARQARHSDQALIELFLDMLAAERGASRNTLAAYARDLADFSAHLAAARHHRCEADDVRGHPARSPSAAWRPHRRPAAPPSASSIGSLCGGPARRRSLRHHRGAAARPASQRCAIADVDGLRPRRTPPRQVGQPPLGAAARRAARLPARCSTPPGCGSPAGRCRPGGRPQRACSRCAARATGEAGRSTKRRRPPCATIWPCSQTGRDQKSKWLFPLRRAPSHPPTFRPRN
jgi:hypothetical protein